MGSLRSSGCDWIIFVESQVRSGCSNDPDEAPDFVTKCVLDIDIYKNRPSVHEHVKLPNPEVCS